MSGPSPRFTPSWVAVVALLALCGLCGARDRAPSPSAAVTHAPIFLPSYDEAAWSVLRGSILSSDNKAGETTYTIFCPTQTCELSLEFPFVVVEGPGTLRFHGTYTSTYIANVECRLTGTTAATCSGYSSYKAGFTNAHYTGPTEISWTSTLSGPDVTWGTLTMAERPRVTDHGLDVTATANAAPAVLSQPAATGQGAGTALGVDRRLAIAAMAGAVLAAGLLPA